MSLNSGRRRFAAAWHEHETPRAVPRRDRRVSARSGLDSKGRPRVTVSQLEEIRARRHGGESVPDLAAEYGVSPVTLYQLLRGRSQPAPDGGGA